MKTNNLMCRVAAVVLAVFLTSGGVSGQETRTAEEEVNKTPRGMGRTVRQIQNRHGGILEAKLSDIIQDLLLSDRDIAQYLEDNKSRRGATIYGFACGGAGDKTIRLVYYAAKGVEGVGGSEFGKVKGWVFTQLAAQGFASKGARLLQSAAGGEFTVSSNIGEDRVEIVIHPTGSPPVDAPVVGETANFR